ncbi:hypothetical protein KC845_01675 [Candidatus Kaiserbacteria bacterium]|nr:hypothetical protein [Candidatus Kaiserbacteria bacterium]
MKELSLIKNSAGKITIITGLVGVVIFAAIFILNFGAKELQKVEAQSNIATTSITVLNTPPGWTVDAEEESESSDANPTNSGDEVAWVATATDPSNQPYFLLVCDSPNSAVPAAAAGYGSLGTAPPSCTATSTQWAVSPAATSGVQARAATTTTEVGDDFNEQNTWYAWICDDDPVLPRCNAVSKQGTGLTASPFNMNSRPVFTGYSNDSPVLPGSVVTITATSSDPDVVPAQDDVQLFVCSTASFNVASSTCTATELASSTLSASNPAATYTITIPTQDDDYPVFLYIIDEHGHAASGGAQGGQSDITVSNAPPVVLSNQITLNDGQDIILTQDAGETTGFQIQFSVSDDNSCENAASGPEISGYELAVYRTTVGTTTCTPDAADYNPNNCYPSGLATSTWNLSCTASSTSCTFGVDGIDTTMVYDCTFPLWYVADPTDGSATTSIHFATDWSVAVRGVDDDLATSSYVQSNTGQELVSFLAYALDTFVIAYQQLEPGQQTDPLVATTTFRATGNIGLDQELSGQAMCSTYSGAFSCPNSATSTIPETEQVFATSSVTYATALGAGNFLSSSTYKYLDLNISKSTATNTQAEKETYWGIAVPGTITYSGAYTGENTFIGAASDASQW